jgi:hypothetical protein
MFEEEENPTTISRPVAGARSANSSGVPTSPVPDWDAPTRVAGSPDATPFDAKIDQARGGSYNSTRNDPTVVLRSGPAMEHAAFLYCRRGLRKGHMHQLRKVRSEIGRDPECDVILEDAAASSRHGAVVLEGEEWKLFDFASTNGTSVNGSKLSVEAANPLVLKDGDSIVVGDTELVFKKI